MLIINHFRNPQKWISQNKCGEDNNVYFSANWVRLLDRDDSK